MAAYRVALLTLLLAGAANADVLPPPAYQLAAKQAGVPAQVLFAVALQESGTHVHGRHLPWPWTLNVAGAAQRFPTRRAACRALLEAATSHDLKRIDVGLGQTNLGHNPDRYAFPCQALDPVRNLAVTASLLREHFDQAGDWLLAAGRYHRPAGGVLARRYRTQIARQLHRLDAADFIAQEPTQ